MLDQHRVKELTLPRVIPDAHYDSHASALEEVRRRLVDVATAVTRIRKSPYGGYVVISVPTAAMAQAIQTGGESILVSDPHGYGEGYLSE